jgi:hypothetical protein
MWSYYVLVSQSLNQLANARWHGRQNLVEIKGLPVRVTLLGHIPKGVWAGRKVGRDGWEPFDFPLRVPVLKNLVENNLIWIHRHRRENPQRFVRIADKK